MKSNDEPVFLDFDDENWSSETKTEDKPKKSKHKKDKPKPTSVFIITVCREDSTWPKPIGLFETLKIAESIVNENKNQIQKDYYSKDKEDYYTYCIIEELEFGLFREVKSRYTFEWDVEKKRFVCTDTSEVCGDDTSICGLF